MNTLSIIFGILAFIGRTGCVCSPSRHHLNWFILPLAFVGLVAGLLAKENSGRNVNNRGHYHLYRALVLGWRNLLGLVGFA